VFYLYPFLDAETRRKVPPGNLLAMHWLFHAKLQVSKACAGDATVFSY
jgi:hypothetical protein